MSYKLQQQTVGVVLVTLLLVGCGTPVVAPTPVVIVVTATPQPIAVLTTLAPAGTQATEPSTDTTATARVIAAREAATARVPALTSEAATTTAEAPARFATATARSATATAEAPSAHATATAQAVQGATAAAGVPATVTAWSATATAKAPSVNATSTAMAVKAEATATYVGVLVSVPSEVKWRWSAGQHKWAWDIQFEEVAGRAITITRKSGDLYTIDGEHAVTGYYNLNIAIPAYGKWSDDFWIRSPVTSNSHDGTFILTYEGVDEHGYEFSIEAVTRFKNEEK